MGSETSADQIPDSTTFFCKLLKSKCSMRALVSLTEDSDPIYATHLPPLFRLKQNIIFEKIRKIKDGNHSITFIKSGQPKIIEIDDVCIEQLWEFTDSFVVLKNMNFEQDLDRCISQLSEIILKFRYYENNLQDIIDLFKIDDYESSETRIRIGNEMLKMFIENWFPEKLCSNGNCFGSSKYLCRNCKSLFCCDGCSEGHECEKEM